MMTASTLFARYMQGNAAATQLLLDLYSTFEIWDDLIDKTREPTQKEIHSAFFAALISLPRNAFYREYFNLLNPLIEAAILDWYAANTLEATKDVENLRSSYVLRCAGYSVLVMCARIIGGIDWANTVNAELRTLGDTWAQYSAKHEVM